MPLPLNSGGPEHRFALAVAILSLGLAPLARAQLASVAKPEPKKPPIEGVAMWYEVPASSLAKKRAGKDELTAAHNRLPFGTKVRVTHLGNGKNVVVRITDRGIHKRNVLIDLCKEAAAKLDMLRQGSARVRLEILPGDAATSDPQKSSHRWWWW